MDDPVLSPGELKRGRKLHYIFDFFNVISFQFVTGNIITLYALKLGAGNALVGLISSFLYLSFFFIFVGKLIIKRIGAVKLMGIFFTVRYFAMIPMLFSPIFSARGNYSLAFTLIIISTAGFNIARGIAIVSDSPIVAELGGEKDRGGFLSRVQIITQVMAIVSGLFMSAMLGSDAPIYRYTIIIGLGIVVGLAGCSFIFKLPEPTSAIEGAADEKVLSSVSRAFKNKNTRVYFLSMFLVNLVISMTSPFLVVYLKDVYAISDNVLILFSTLANVGAFFMAILSGFTMDRLGSKPLYFSFTAVSIVALFPAVISPSITSSSFLVFFACFIYFFQGMGSAGMNNSSLNYFFGITSTKDRLNYGIIYYVLMGAGGTIGSLAGGEILDFFLTTLKMGVADSFRFYFGILSAILVVILFIIHSLENAGSYPLKNAIMFIFSPRDLKALSLLRKLDNSLTVDEESRVIQELKSVPSELTVDDIIRKIKSPSFLIRSQALNAFREIPLDKESKKLLISEVKNHPYTTGHLAAEIMGNRGITEGIQALRNAVSSPDTLLAGKSMIALSQLKDWESIPRIERIMRSSRNPRLIIYAARALSRFAAPSSATVLLGGLEAKQAPFIRDEIILALSEYLGFEDWFYPLYTNYLERATVGIAMLKDFISDSMKDDDSGIKEELITLADSATRGRGPFIKLATALLKGRLVSPGTSMREEEDISSVFAKAVANPHLLKLDRFRYFICALIIRSYCSGQ
ncbi:MAG TPA: MFS transporter [Spirochaetia bacterium]|nr:MFS transporter [Spirochaetia bacterium]